MPLSLSDDWVGNYMTLKTSPNAPLIEITQLSDIVMALQTLRARRLVEHAAEIERIDKSIATLRSDLQDAPAAVAPWQGSRIQDKIKMVLAAMPTGLKAPEVRNSIAKLSNVPPAKIPYQSVYNALAKGRDKVGFWSQREDGTWIPFTGGTEAAPTAR